MAIGLIELLTAGAREAFPMLTSLAETELSANAILQQVKDAGYAIRRQTGLDIIGALRDNVNAARQFRLISNTTIPDPNKFGTALTNIIRDYSYKVKVSGGPESFPTHITISSNDVLNKDQILGTADAYLSNAEVYAGADTEDVNYSLDVVDALRSPALGEIV